MPSPLPLPEEDLETLSHESVFKRRDQKYGEFRHPTEIQSHENIITYLPLPYSPDLVTLSQSQNDHEKGVL